jgi:phosphatidate cytidylyltransferase
MLKQRILTALVLLGVLLPCLFYPQVEPFAALMALMVVLGGWEWARLNGLGPRGSCFYGALMGAGLLGYVWVVGLNEPIRTGWRWAALAWVLSVLFILRRSVSGWGRWPSLLRLCLGAAVLWLAWLALVKARMLGVNYLLSVLCLVWMADIAAYFGGKTWGRHKLAPTISPGKTWEGVFAGVTGVVLMAAAWAWADRTWSPDSPSIYTHLWALGPLWGVVGLACLTAMSVIGDLVESLVKRSAGAKDSSALLPGHGGVLDRVDALLPVLPLAMMVASL